MSHKYYINQMLDESKLHSRNWINGSDGEEIYDVWTNRQDDNASSLTFWLENDAGTRYKFDYP